MAEGTRAGRRSAVDDPLRWTQVRSLAEAVLSQPLEARGEFLDRIGDQDAALRDEVDAQVRACERAAQSAAFLASPAAAFAAPLLDAPLLDAPLLDGASGLALGPAPADAAEPAETEAALRASLAGRYTVERELGRGGMATVYLAHDVRHDRRVAVKVLRPDLGGAIGADRFLREIGVTARLAHPHILTLIDSGRVGGDPGAPDLLYYVMPYVDGESLRDRLARDGALPPPEAVRLLREIVDAVAYAHRRGVVHRDLKPANILLAERHALVADFGIARVVGGAAEQSTLTATGVSLGTPAYMAPEQALGGHADERADLYALGVVAYELLAGRPPFAGTPREVVAAHVTAPPPPLVAARPGVPPALARVVMRCLEKDPVARFASADELLRALDTLVEPHGGVRRSPAAARRRTWVTAAALAALTVVAGATTLAVRERRTAWVRAYAVPTILLLADSGRTDSAFALAERAEAMRPRDSLLATVWGRVAFRRAVHSDPEGARVYRARFGDTTRWELVGTTPTDTVRLPLAMTRYRFEKAGYRAATLLAGGLLAGPGARITVSGAALPGSVPLARADSRDTDMVRVRGPLLTGDEVTGGERLRDFFIGRYEVTNAQYKAFVDAGGYRRRELWTDPFQRDGRPISWEQAMALFVDRTGRPGPATWEGGAPPDGQERLPVGGVSWYEAAAFARFVGRALPTVVHWKAAAVPSALSYVVRGSNFASAGPRRGGDPAGMSPWGVFDMAGNVREWCANEESGGRRHILGGAWTDDSYRFGSDDPRPALERLPGDGIRLASYPTDDPLLARALVPTREELRDYTRERPVSDAAFAALRAAYDYDPAPLDARVESRDTTPGDWVRERVSFAAAYGRERVPALLFLPKRHAPPYQTVVYFPTSEALHARSSDEIDAQLLGFLVRSGRAVLHPIYKGMYERSDPHFRAGFDASIAYRDAVVAWGKDLRRSVDYLASRADVDTARLAYAGTSTGGRLGVLMLALEPRFHAGVLYIAGLGSERVRPEADPLNFAPRVRVPVLMLNGRYDTHFPVETGQRPLYRLLGTPESQKRWVLYDDGHDLPRAPMIAESLAWLDRWLGPVTR